MEQKKLLDQGLLKLNLILTNEQKLQLLKYYELIIEKNKVVNLTAITEFDDVVTKHFVDSLSLFRNYKFENNESIIDVGTGAGFPGIPLKIAFPGISVLLLDSLNKRVKFLNEVIEELDLKNIKAVHGRAEDLGRDKLYREKYDFCVSRAVANLATLSEYCIPFVKVGGHFISYKSGKINEEIENSKKAIDVLGSKFYKIDEFILPDSDIERSLVIIEKVKKTPIIYPRISGKPSKEPIC